MNKSKMLYGIATLFAFLCLTLNSCKKESIAQLTDAEKTQLAKDWYNSQQTKISSKIALSNGKKTKLIFNPNWDKVKIENIGNVAAISAPVNTTLRNFDQGRTEFKLIIKFDGDKIESKTVAITNDGVNKNKVLTPSELYNVAFTNLEISKENLNVHLKVYSNGFNLEKEESYNINGRRTINLKPNTISSIPFTSSVTVCIHYYIITDTYNSNNEFIGSSFQYLGYFCSEVNTTTIDWIDNGDGTYHGGTEY